MKKLRFRYCITVKCSYPCSRNPVKQLSKEGPRPITFFQIKNTKRISTKFDPNLINEIIEAVLLILKKYLKFN